MAIDRSCGHGAQSFAAQDLRRAAPLQVRGSLKRLLRDGDEKSPLQVRRTRRRLGLGSIWDW